jgi:catechol 2,3-dioxygenase-like lactoylglutathione lyase family enzyme
MGHDNLRHFVRSLLRHSPDVMQSSGTMERAMITGTHVVIYSRNADADRAFFRDVLGFPCVDAGKGWLIFATPPSEIACHPGENDSKQEFYLLCDDIENEVATLSGKGVQCSAVTDQGWGLLTTIQLPGGGELGLYQPRHPRPASQ